jgi:hypothetical protein
LEEEVVLLKRLESLSLWPIWHCSFWCC